MSAKLTFSTTFDDGSVILTWSKSPPPTRSSARVESGGGSGDLTADFATHCAAIERRRLATPHIRTIPAVTVDDCVLLSEHHDRFATTDAELTNTLMVRVYAWGVLAALATAAVWALSKLAMHGCSGP